MSVTDGMCRSVYDGMSSVVFMSVAMPYCKFYGITKY